MRRVRGGSVGDRVEPRRLHAVKGAQALDGASEGVVGCDDAEGEIIVEKELTLRDFWKPLKEVDDFPLTPW